MSYDLMVFEITKAPKTRKDFMAWYQKQIEWGEDHDYETIGVSSNALQNWFMEMKNKFPPMNGEYAINLDPEDEDEAEELEEHTVDYCIGKDVIYASFSWSVEKEAYNLTKELARKHGVGFFDVSANDGDIILPDDTKIE